VEKSFPLEVWSKTNFAVRRTPSTFLYGADLNDGSTDFLEILHVDSTRTVKVHLEAQILNFPFGAKLWGSKVTPNSQKSQIMKFVKNDYIGLKIVTRGFSTMEISFLRKFSKSGVPLGVIWTPVG